MSILILLAFLAGAVLGMRFKVLILIPAIGITSITIVGAGIAGGAPLSAILTAVLFGLTCLQIGYLGGIFTRYCMAMARAERLSSVARRAESVR